MASGRGMFSISRKGSRARGALVLVGLTGAVLVAGLPANAHTPEHGLDPTVTLTVYPDDALTDGQNVFVTGTGFPANQAGLIRECAGSVAAPECDTIVQGIFFTSPTGEIPPSPMTVNRVVNTFATSYNCGVQSCALVADAAGKSSRHHITFAAAGTVMPTTTPTTIGGATTVPTIPGQTTIPGPTTIPSATTVPPPPTTIGLPPQVPNLLCAILQPISNLLGGLLNGLLVALGCLPPAG